MEDISPDVRYLAHRTGLGSRLEDLLSATQRRKTTGMQDKEREFWSRVELGTVAKVKEFYREDLLLFGYSVEEYFRRLGLENYLTDETM